MKKLIPFLLFAGAVAPSFAIDMSNGNHTWSDKNDEGIYTSFSGEITELPASGKGSFTSHHTGTHTIDFDYTIKTFTSSWNTNNPVVKIASGKVLTINEYRGSFRGADNRAASVTFTGDASSESVPYGLIFTSGMRLVPTESEPTLLGVNSTYDVNLDVATNFTATETTLYTDNGSKAIVQADGTLGKRVSAGINVLKSANFAGNVVLNTTLYNGVTNYTPLAFRVGSATNSLATATVAKNLTLASDYTSLHVYGTMNVNGNIDASKGAVTIYKGGTLQLNRTATSSFSTITLKNLDIYGTLYYKTTSTEVNQDTFVIASGGSVNVKNGGQLKSSGSGERHIYLSKDATLTYEAGALKNSGISRIKLTDDGATVKLYSDALNTSHLTITKSSASVNLVVGADAKIARIHLWNTNSVDLNISFENDAILTINDMFRSGANFYECGHELFLTNFEDYGSTSSIRFSDATFIAKLQGVAASWVKDSFHADGWEDFYVDDGGYLHATRVIPEPSTYAVIFGCIALMLVLYRRRR